VAQLEAWIANIDGQIWVQRIMPTTISMNKLRLVVAAISGFLLIGCHSNLCSNEFLKEQSSPDGKWKYISFARNCGATTAENFQISVLPSTTSLPEDAGNVFIGDYNHGAATHAPEIEWIGSNALQIGYSSKARIFRQERHIGPIEIKYLAKP